MRQIAKNHIITIFSINYGDDFYSTISLRLVFPEVLEPMRQYLMEESAKETNVLQ